MHIAIQIDKACKRAERPNSIQNGMKQLIERDRENKREREGQEQKIVPPTRFFPRRMTNQIFIN